MVTFAFVPHIGLSLTYDHRAIDGGPATKFLAEIRNEIENFEWNPAPHRMTAREVNET